VLEPGLIHLSEEAKLKYSSQIDGVEIEDEEPGLASP